MRPVRSTAVVAALATASLADAQSLPRHWQSGATEFSPLASWAVTPSDHGMGEIGIECVDGRPTVFFTDGQRLDRDLQGQLNLQIGSRTFDLPASYSWDGAEPRWEAPADPILLSALRNGSRVAASAPEQQSLTFSLEGSFGAITEALEGCGEARAAPPAPAEAPPEPAASGPAGAPATGDTTAAMTMAEAPVSMEALQATAVDACNGGQVEFGPATITLAEIDGDGRTDLLFDWSKVTCTGAETAGMSRGAGHCGMHMCSVDVYASSVHGPEGYPQSILALGFEVQPLGSDVILTTTSMGGSCPSAEICDHGWRWSGSELESAD